MNDLSEQNLDQILHQHQPENNNGGMIRKALDNYVLPTTMATAGGAMSLLKTLPNINRVQKETFIS